MKDGRLCHQALTVAEEVDQALEKWTEPALASIIATLRAILPGPSTSSPLDPYLPAGVSLSSLLALLDASLVALASELEASSAAQRALTLKDHFKLTMAIQRAEDALFMKDQVLRVGGKDAKGKASQARRLQSPGGRREEGPR